MVILCTDETVVFPSKENDILMAFAVPGQFELFACSGQIRSVFLLGRYGSTWESWNPLRANSGNFFQALGVSQKLSDGTTR